MVREKERAKHRGIKNCRIQSGTVVSTVIHGGDRRATYSSPRHKQSKNCQARVAMDGPLAYRFATAAGRCRLHREYREIKPDRPLAVEKNSEREAIRRQRSGSTRQRRWQPTMRIGAYV